MSTQPSPPDHHLLHPGETLLQAWRPNLRIFLRKLLWVGFLTTLFLGSGALLTGRSTTEILLIWIVSTPVAMVFYIFIFGDYEEWFQRRGERWILTDQRLIFLAPNSSPDPMPVDLGDIVNIKGWMWWSLRVRLIDDQKMTMDYLPNRANVRTSILAARDSATGVADG